MKKSLVVIAAVAAIAAASSAFAGSIQNTKHDLSSASQYTTWRGTSNQLCVYCHTPHNSAQTRALWNRLGGTAYNTFKLYTSGAIADQAAWFASGTKGQFKDGSGSILCMTCHDGVTSMNSLNNQPKDGGSASANKLGTVGGAAYTSTANLGTDLTNDHPVNINYDTVQAANSTLFKTGANVYSGGLPLSAQSSGTMECSTCHNVHSNDFPPFLRISNTGSALCLKCHIK